MPVIVLLLLLGWLFAAPIRAEVPVSGGDFGFATARETSETLSIYGPMIWKSYQLPNGGLGVVYAASTFGTSYSEDSVTDVFYSTADPEGRRWSTPDPIKTYFIDEGESWIASDSSTSGTIVVVWIDNNCWSNPGCGDPPLSVPGAGSYFMVARSGDSGVTWDPTKRIATSERYIDNRVDDFGGVSPRIGSLSTNGQGDWLFFSGYAPGTYPPTSPITDYDVYCLKSEDDGKTWTPLFEIPSPGSPDQWISHAYGVEFVTEDTVIALTVDYPDSLNSRLNHLLSEDKGMTWTFVGPVDVALESFYDSFGRLYRLPSGRLLCVSLSKMPGLGPSIERYFIFSPETMSWSAGFEFDLSAIPGYVDGVTRLTGLDCDDERCLALFTIPDNGTAYMAELDLADLAVRRATRLEITGYDRIDPGSEDNCVHTDGRGNWFLWLTGYYPGRALWLHSYNLQPTNTGFMAR